MNLLPKKTDQMFQTELKPLVTAIAALKNVAGLL